MQKIIDISSYQKYVDFTEIKKAGIEGVIIKIGWFGNRNNFKVDSYFEEYYRKAKENNLNIGFYVYSYGRTLESYEFGYKKVKELLKDKKFNLPVFLDLEDITIRFVKNLTVYGITFCNSLIHDGINSGIYANLDWFNHVIDKYAIKKVNIPMWLAWYKNFTYNEIASLKNDGYSLVQFSSSGKISGIHGNVDLNWLLNDKIVNNKNKEKTENDYKQLANLIIEGKYGNGEERKKNVEALGFDYEKVQAIVNEIILNESHEIYYIVKKGDSLSKIASKFNTSIDKIVKFNNIKNKNLIFAGQKLRVK